MDDEFKDLQTLLRLKKYEQPPQGFDAYSERFLKEFHRRQRWEESRKTGWAAWSEKVGDWMNMLTVPRYAYVATLGLFGVIALSINSHQPADPVANVASAPMPSTHVHSPRALALNTPLDLSDLEAQAKIQTGSQFANSGIQPRYILDMRPASYDASFSF